MNKLAKILIPVLTGAGLLLATPCRGEGINVNATQAKSIETVVNANTSKTLKAIPENYLVSYAKVFDYKKNMGLESPKTAYSKDLFENERWETHLTDFRILNHKVGIDLIRYNRTILKEPRTYLGFGFNF